MHVRINFRNEILTPLPFLDILHVIPRYRININISLPGAFKADLFLSVWKRALYTESSKVRSAALRLPLNYFFPTFFARFLIFWRCCCCCCPLLVGRGKCFAMSAGQAKTEMKSSPCALWH